MTKIFFAVIVSLLKLTDLYFFIARLGGANLGGIMSIVIVGGNDHMVSNYKNICKQYKCNAKVYTQMKGTLRDKIGQPDLLILFTGTVSHEMVHCAVKEVKGTNTIIARARSSSISSLKSILDSHVNE